MIGLDIVSHINSATNTKTAKVAPLLMNLPRLTPHNCGTSKSNPAANRIRITIAEPAVNMFILSQIILVHG